MAEDLLECAGLFLIDMLYNRCLLVYVHVRDVHTPARVYLAADAAPWPLPIVTQHSSSLCLCLPKQTSENEQVSRMVQSFNTC